jgi:hypothetical protein
MANPIVTTTADTSWAAMSAAIIAQQTAYAAAHGGRFFQGILTPPTIPPTAVPVAPTLNLKPSYQPEDWTAFLGAATIGASLAYSIEIHQYSGPQGRGWEVRLWGMSGPTKWLRRINFGPETYRDRTWAPVVGG